jgi:hypothetical protein
VSELPDRLPEYEPPPPIEDLAAQLLSQTWHTAAEFETNPLRIAHRVMDELNLFPVLERYLSEHALDDL